MNRLFLSWDQPACRAVAERLLSLGNDFYRHLVLVPTRESGRQLRECLASIARGQAVFAPQVIPADQFPRMEEKEETASALEELAGWLLALGDSPHSLYPRLFPHAMPEDFASMLEIAGSLQSLRHAMANQGISCGMAHHACAGRDERWTDMDRLAERCAQQLKDWQLADRTAMAAEAPPHLLKTLRETGGNVILACTADVPRPLRQALQHAELHGVPVQIWIHAPEEEEASFDPWGCPLPEDWNQRPIHIRDGQIRITANPTRLAGEACRVIARTAEGGTPDVALGVCDPDMNVALDSALRTYGWGLHNPEGKPFAETGVMDLLRHLRQALEEKGAARPVFCLARSSLLCASLGIGDQQSCCAALDKIRQQFLPESEEYLLSRLKELYPGALPSIRAILAWRDRMAAPGMLGERLMEWFPALADAYGPDTEAMDTLHSCLSGLIRLQQRSTAFSNPEKALPLLIKCLQPLRVKNRRKPDAILDSLGWMEVHFRPEKHLILTGLNEGTVPEGGVSDQFMPEELKETLGIDSLNRKKARDSFLLTSLLHSREREGSLTIILSRTSSRNDPLTPSSLLMRCPEAELPRRVEQLFREISDPPAPLPYQRGNWHLQPAEGWKTATDISAMAPGYKNPWKEKSRAFSPSVLKRFLACPMRFWMREVLRMNEDEFLPDKEDMAARELGTMTHGVLERFCREHAVLKDGMNAPALQDAITEILEQTFREQYGSAPLMPLLLQKRSMDQRLSVYAVQHLQNLRDGWSCIAFEQQVENWTLGGFPMKFRIDRIDRHADGRVRVIDYKTGAAASCEEKHLKTIKRPDALSLLSPSLRPYTKRQKNGNLKHERWKDLQLPVYVLWAMETYGGHPSAAYYTLPANPLDIGISAWDTLHDPMPGYEECALDSARSWAVELMKLLHEGRGLITAEELGWGPPSYDVFQNLMTSQRESLQDMLGLRLTPHLPF